MSQNVALRPKLASFEALSWSRREVAMWCCTEASAKKQKKTQHYSLSLSFCLAQFAVSFFLNLSSSLILKLLFPLSLRCLHATAGPLDLAVGLAAERGVLRGERGMNFGRHARTLLFHMLVSSLVADLSIGEFSALKRFLSFGLVCQLRVLPQVVLHLSPSFSPNGKRKGPQN